jgi:hypothetical protein
MGTLGRFIVVILLAALAGGLLRYFFVRSADESVAAGPRITLPSVSLSPQPFMQGPVTLTGTVLIDRNSGYPYAPYIKYTDEKGRTRTKQLVYYGVRGCNPNAGDFPCVPSYPTDYGYPKVEDGSPIRAEGYLNDDRLIVTRTAVER